MANVASVLDHLASRFVVNLDNRSGFRIRDGRCNSRGCVCSVEEINEERLMFQIEQVYGGLAVFQWWTWGFRGVTSYSCLMNLRARLDRRHIGFSTIFISEQTFVTQIECLLCIHTLLLLGRNTVCLVSKTYVKLFLEIVATQCALATVVPIQFRDFSYEFW